MLKRDLAKAFGAVLRQHRERKGITQEILSEKADVDVKMIYMVEQGKRNPSLNLADSLAAAIGVPLSELVKAAETLRDTKGGVRLTSGKRRGQDES